MIATDSSVVDPLAEMKREHAEVVRPLLDRMSHLADLIDAGVPVSARTISNGIDLWIQYVNGLHGPRLKMMRSEKVGACDTGLKSVLENRDRSSDRMVRLRELTEEYRRGDPRVRGILAIALRSAVQVDRAWIEFEEENPISCLSEELKGTEARDLEERFRENEGQFPPLESRIHSYLAAHVEVASNSVEVRCNVASCPSRALVDFRGDAREWFSLSAPPKGWVLRSIDDGGAVLDRPGSLGFFCPVHASMKQS